MICVAFFFVGVVEYLKHVSGQRAQGFLEGRREFFVYVSVKCDESPRKVWAADAVRTLPVVISKISVGKGDSAVELLTDLCVPEEARHKQLLNCYWPSVKRIFDALAASGGEPRVSVFTVTTDAHSANKKAARLAVSLMEEVPRFKYWVCLPILCFAHLLANVAKTSYNVKAFCIGEVVRLRHVLGVVRVETDALESLVASRLSVSECTLAEAVLGARQWECVFRQLSGFGELPKRVQSLKPRLKALFPLGPFSWMTGMRKTKSLVQEVAEIAKIFVRRAVAAPSFSRWDSVAKTGSFFFLIETLPGLAQCVFPPDLQLRWWPGESDVVVSMEETRETNEKRKTKLDKTKRFLGSASYLESIAVAVFSGDWRRKRPNDEDVFTSLAAMRRKADAFLAGADKDAISLLQAFVSCKTSERGDDCGQHIITAVLGSFLRGVVDFNLRFRGFSRFPWKLFNPDLPGDVGYWERELAAVGSSDDGFTNRLRTWLLSGDSEEVSVGREFVRRRLEVGAFVRHGGGVMDNEEIESRFSWLSKMDTGAMPHTLSTLSEKYLMKVALLQHSNFVARCDEGGVPLAGEEPDNKAAQPDGRFGRRGLGGYQEFLRQTRTSDVTMAEIGKMWRSMGETAKRVWRARASERAISEEKRRMDVVSASAVAPGKSHGKERRTNRAPGGPVGPFGGKERRLVADPGEYASFVRKFPNSWRKRGVSAARKQVDNRKVGEVPTSRSAERRAGGIALPWERKDDGVAAPEFRGFVSDFRDRGLEERLRSGKGTVTVELLFAGGEAQIYDCVMATKRPEAIWALRCARAPGKAASCVVVADGELHKPVNLRDAMRGAAGWRLIEKRVVVSEEKPAFRYEVAAGSEVVPIDPAAVRKRGRYTARGAQERRAQGMATVSSMRKALGRGSSSEESTGGRASREGGSDAGDSCSGSSSSTDLAAAVSDEDLQEDLRNILGEEEKERHRAAVLPGVDGRVYDVFVDRFKGTVTASHKRSEQKRIGAAALRSKAAQAKQSEGRALRSSRTMTLSKYGVDGCARGLSEWARWHTGVVTQGARSDAGVSATLSSASSAGSTSSSTSSGTPSDCGESSAELEDGKPC